MCFHLRKDHFEFELEQITTPPPPPPLTTATTTATTTTTDFYELGLSKDLNVHYIYKCNNLIVETNLSIYGYLSFSHSNLI